MSAVRTRAAGALVAVGLMLVLVASAAGQSAPLVFIGDGATPYTVTEGPGTKTVTIPVTLNQASSTQVAVDWYTQSGWLPHQASDNGFRVDYQAASGTVVFAPGQTAKTVSVTIFDDGIAEQDESFVVGLRNPVGAQIGIPPDFWTHGAVVTIHDNELGVFIGDGGFVLAAPEGDSGTTPFEVPVRLNFASASPVTVGWTTGEAPVNDPRDAATADQDYQAATGSLTFAPGETEKTVAVQIIGDTLSEGPEEEFRVLLTNPVGAQIGVAWDNAIAATVGIQDDDPADVSIDDVTVTEGDADTSNATFTLTRSSFGNDRFPNPVSVDWVAEGITAEPGSDFVAASGTVTFGGLTERVDVPVVGDTVAEPNETFRVVLSNPQNAVITDGVGIGTILNDDSSPPPPPTGTCILLSAASVSISGTASTPSTPRHADSEHLTVHNCGDSAVHLDARATDASGTAGTWELRSSGGTGCDLGLNAFRAQVTLFLGAAQAATALAKTDTALAGADGTTPFALGAALDQELSIGADLPCNGSVGLGAPMTTNVTLTAVSP